MVLPNPVVILPVGAPSKLVFRKIGFSTFPAEVPVLCTSKSQVSCNKVLNSASTDSVGNRVSEQK